MGSVPPGRHFVNGLRSQSRVKHRNVCSPTPGKLKGCCWHGAVLNGCCGTGLGYSWAFNAPRLAESWGFADWPRWGGLYHPRPDIQFRPVCYVSRANRCASVFLVFTQKSDSRLTHHTTGPLLAWHVCRGVALHSALCGARNPAADSRAALIISLTLASTRRRLVGSPCRKTASARGGVGTLQAAERPTASPERNHARSDGTLHLDRSSLGSR